MPYILKIYNNASTYGEQRIRGFEEKADAEKALQEAVLEDTGRTVKELVASEDAEEYGSTVVTFEEDGSVTYYKTERIEIAPATRRVLSGTKMGKKVKFFAEDIVALVPQGSKTMALSYETTALHRGVLLDAPVDRVVDKLGTRPWLKVESKMGKEGTFIDLDKVIIIWTVPEEAHEEEGFRTGIDFNQVCIATDEPVESLMQRIDEALKTRPTHPLTRRVRLTEAYEMPDTEETMPRPVIVFADRIASLTEEPEGGTEVTCIRGAATFHVTESCEEIMGKFSEYWTAEEVTEA